MVREQADRAPGLSPPRMSSNDEIFFVKFCNSDAILANENGPQKHNRVGGVFRGHLHQLKPMTRINLTSTESVHEFAHPG